MIVARPWSFATVLEGLRADAIAGGADVPRPEPGDGSPNEKITDWLLRIRPLMEKLTEGVPADSEDRTAEQQGRWILANILDFHRREEKAIWWEFFRLSDLTSDDLMDERVSSLRPTLCRRRSACAGQQGDDARSPLQLPAPRYRPSRR